MLARAKERSLPATEARGDVAVAKGSFAGARAPFIQNPYLEFQADTSRITEGGIAFTAFTFIPVELNGQRGARIDEAERQVDWRRFGLADAQSRAMGEAIYAYGEVLTIAARLDDAARAEQDARSEVDFITARRQVGDATIFDQSLAEAEASRWSQIRSELAIASARARGRLAELMGEPVVDEPRGLGPAELPKLQQPVADGTLKQIVDQSPVVRANQAQSSYWDASRERLERDKYPALNLIVNAGRGDVGEARVGGGLSWTFPFFRRNQTEIAQAEAQRDRAAAVAATLRNVVEARARAALEALQASERGVTEQDKTGIPAAQRVVDSAFTSYRAGKGELLRVFIARRDLALARFRRLDFVLSAWAAYGELTALKGALP